MEKCKNLKSPDTGGRVQVSIDPHKLEGEWVRLAELKREIDELKAIPNMAYELFLGLSENALQAIMIHRHLNQLTWEEIADRMGISVRWAKELGKQAEEELAYMLGDCTPKTNWLKQSYEYEKNVTGDD